MATSEKPIQFTEAEKPVASKPVAPVDIFTVAEKDKETFTKTKYTNTFGMYELEYFLQTVLVYVLTLWFIFHMGAVIAEMWGANWSWLSVYHDDFMQEWLIDGVIYGNKFLPSTNWKIAFLIFFAPLTYLEFRKTISTHKDHYRVAWHQLFMWNAFMNYIAIALSVYISGSIYKWDYYYMWIALPFVHMFLWAFHDIFKYVIPIFAPGCYLNVIDDDNETATYYEIMKVSCSGAYGAGIDLGFNLYDAGLPTEDYTRTPHEAQQAKYHHAWEKLELKPGMKVMDIGCGMGDWLAWMKNEKGCKVVGLNITRGHADVVEDRGIPCLRGSWQSFLKKIEDGDQAFISLYCNQFDCVTCWDTIEHYVKGKDVWNVKVIMETYRNLFKLAHSLLNKNSECGTFWSSTLHQSRRLCSNPLSSKFWLEWGNCYIMNCTYNGCYPTDIVGGSVCKGLKERAKPQFELIYESDRIEDYRMTSVINPNHFGNFVIDWNIRFIYSLFVEFLAHPHALSVMFNCMFRVESCWMWHVGGVKQTIAPDCPTKLLWQSFKFDPTIDSFAELEEVTETGEAAKKATV